MLYLLSDLSSTFTPLNVFRYITFRTGGAMFTAGLFVFWFGPWIISLLRLRQGKGQPIREDGPQTHLLTKRGTPTMGGLMILAGFIVSVLLWANPRNHYVWITLAVTLGFGAIGFYDDYLKVTKQSHKGFSGKFRLGLEGMIALAACVTISACPACRSASPCASRRTPTPAAPASAEPTAQFPRVASGGAMRPRTLFGCGSDERMQRHEHDRSQRHQQQRIDPGHHQQRRRSDGDAAGQPAAVQRFQQHQAGGEDHPRRHRPQPCFEGELPAGPPVARPQAGEGIDQQRTRQEDR